MSYVERGNFTWAPRGRPPVLKRLTRFRRETSTWVALTISGKIYKRHFDGGIQAEQVVAGLEHLVHHLPGPLTLIWDRAQAHRAKKMQVFLQVHPQIEVEYLPPYAPELNPEEYCHGNVNRRLKNGVFQSKAEIRQQLDRSFARLRKRPDILSGCFRHAGLEVN